MTPRPANDPFVTTRWTLVLAAGAGDGVAKREALAAICATYWSPIFEYIRRRGNDPEHARDLTQEFLARLLEHDWLAGLEREGSKFRAFLIVAVKRFLATEYEKQSAQKRGGGIAPLSLDGVALPELSACEETPERAFDRRWALTVIDRAMIRLRDEAAKSGRDVLFAEIAPFLSIDPESGAYEGVSERLGLSRSAVALAVHRLRLRLRDHVRAEVAETLVDPRQVDAEMRELMAALRA